MTGIFGSPGTFEGTAPTIWIFNLTLSQQLDHTTWAHNLSLQLDHTTWAYILIIQLEPTTWSYCSFILLQLDHNCSLQSATWVYNCSLQSATWVYNCSLQSATWVYNLFSTTWNQFPVVIYGQYCRGLTHLSLSPRSCIYDTSLHLIYIIIIDIPINSFISVSQVLYRALQNLEDNFNGMKLVLCCASIR